MGLDLVEYVMALEDAFEIAIPHEDAVRLETPRQLIDYLCSRVGEAEDGPPLVQVAFYRIRSAVAKELKIERPDIRPSTTLAELAPHRDATELWLSVAPELGVQRRELTHGPLATSIRRVVGAKPTTIGSAAEELCMARPNALRARDTPWTRAQVTDVALRLLKRKIAVDVRRDQLDLKFVRDLGMG
jgi:hypothetical protein